MVTFAGVAPTSSTTLNTTSTGSFEISGLIQACKTGMVGMYESPLIDQRWQIQLSFNDPSYVRLSFLAKHCPSEALDKAGDRKGLYEVSVSMRLGLMNQSHTEPFRRYQPTQYTFPASGWSHDYWISKSGILDYNRNSDDVASLVYNITERSEELPPTRAMTTLPDIAASIFDDEETSNVVFAISDPRRSTRHDEYIYAHTKILAIRSDYFKSIFSTKIKDVYMASIHESDLGVKEFSDVSESEIEDDLTDGTLTPEDSLKDVTSTLKRRVVRVTDASYATYRAMLYFLYTGLYSFVPLTSTCQQTSGANDFCDPLGTLAEQLDSDLSLGSQIYSSSDVPRSNAKGIYKLCDRLDIPELKAAALLHIQSSLTPENITTELNSPFTSRFPEIRRMENEYLKSHWKDIRDSHGFSKLITKAFGDQPDGVADMWLEFFKQL